MRHFTVCAGTREQALALAHAARLAIGLDATAMAA